MKIVVTGALGHIGSRLIRGLPKQFKHLEIVMIDDLSTQRYSSLFNLPTDAKYTFIEGKIKDIDLDSILNGGGCVIHLAALTDAAGTADKPELVYQNNFESTSVLAKACLKHNIPIIYPSSTSVYGSQSDVVDETCKELLPQSPYADCKLKEEDFLKTLFQQGLKGIICRFGTIYGVSHGMRFHTAVNKFCWQAVMGQSLTVWETAMDQKRPYLALDDAVRAIEWIIQHQLFHDEIYNIVTHNLTVRDVISVIKEKITDLNVSYVQHRIMNQLSYEVSSSKFQKTGFNFEGKLDEGIIDTIELLQQANS